jgi:hypothetical protein
MNRNTIACLALAAAGVLLAWAPASAGDAISQPGKKQIGQSQNQNQNEMIPSLAVLNAKGATLQGNKLTLAGVSPNSIVFADRPVRAAGHVLTSHFIKEWDEGNDSFSKDPPNATISVFGKDGTSVKDAVVVLKSPKLEGEDLTFDVSVLEGDLNGADGAAALFIDWFAARGPYGGVVVGRAPAWHGAWYGHPGAAFAAGVAVGAAPYYHPYRCGYYPYPPCY